MAAASKPRVFLSSVFDAGLHEPVRATCPGLIWDPREERKINPGSIESVCRKLIRHSKLFVGIFDERGGRALFEDGIEPVTVLEIELLQALFEQMPIYLFLLPGFAANRRLSGLVQLAQERNVATVVQCPESFIAADGQGNKSLTQQCISVVARVVRDPIFQRLARKCFALSLRLRPFRALDVMILDHMLGCFNDPFDAAKTALQLDTADQQANHAARLSYLWPALRQLASVPYGNPVFSTYRPLWERLAGAWDRSAAWYGLHDDSPIGRLSATNTVIWIQENSPVQTTNPILAHGARASAFYSMAKRLWLPWQRRRFFGYALSEVNSVLGLSSHDPSGYLAIRGSIQLQFWRISKAIADYEAVIEFKSGQPNQHSSHGEAWVELGWAYLHALRIEDARNALRKGLKLLREDRQRNPNLGIEFFSRALLKSAMAFGLMFHFREAYRAASEGCQLARERTTQDQLRGLRGLLCKVLGD